MARRSRINKVSLAPEQPEATQDSNKYIVSCENCDSVQMDLIWDTFTIGKVTDRDGSYVCPITIK
ncbi:MAG: hypothetical protein ACLTEE_06200 [Anaerobutyricum hallii]